jgi:hypothetical protein
MNWNFRQITKMDGLILEVEVKRPKEALKRFTFAYGKD